MERWFIHAGRLEAFSFLTLLLVAMPLKYYWHLPQAVRIIGMAHGIFFVLYIALAFLLSSRDEWRVSKILLAIVAAFIPCGTFWFERRYLQKPYA